MCFNRDCNNYMRNCIKFHSIDVTSDVRDYNNDFSNSDVNRGFVVITVIVVSLVIVT